MSDALQVWLHDATLGVDQQVGDLARESKRGREVVRFEYTKAWLAARGRTAFALAPDLPLTPGAFFPDAGHALPGVFEDATPDRWGRTLLERRAARQLSEWDFLLGVNDTTRLGALRLFDPERQVFLDDREPAVPPVARLRELQAAARVLDDPDAEAQAGYAEALRVLIQPGSSLGGARPKASFLEADGSLWLAKFPAHDDRHDVSAWELLAHHLARAAGVEVPEARLMKFAPRYRTFCVQRFDRAAGARRHYASAMTLLRRKDGDSASYLDIALALSNAGDPARLAADLAALYRRIVFFIFIGNRDDHLRNHGFLRGAQGWHLSPAFDINPNPDKPVHALAIDDQDARPVLANLHATRDYYRLTGAAARHIEDEVRAAVSGWRTTAEAIGIPAGEQAQLARVIDPGR